MSETGRRDSRGLKVDATPSDAWAAIAQFVRESAQQPGAAWGGLDVAARASVERTRAVCAEIERLAHGLGPAVRVERASLGLCYGELAGFVACQISVDVTRLSRLPVPNPRARLVELLLALSRLEGYEIRTRLGRSACSIDEAIRGIPESQPPDPRQSHWGAPPRESARRGDSARGGYGARQERRDTRWSRGPGWQWSQGQSGARTPPPPRETRTQTIPVELFLRKTGLQPPFTAQSLKKAFRAKAAELHPDHRPNDPAANEEFRIFLKGYEELIGRVGAPGG